MEAEPPQVQLAAQSCPTLIPAHDAGQLPFDNGRVGTDAQTAAAGQKAAEVQARANVSCCSTASGGEGTELGDGGGALLGTC